MVSWFPENKEYTQASATASAPVRTSKIQEYL